MQACFQPGGDGADAKGELKTERMHLQIHQL
jgi:hypothetical protein